MTPTFYVTAVRSAQNCRNIAINKKDSRESQQRRVHSTSMGFFSEQRSKWRTRHNSANASDDCDFDLEEVSFTYSGGPLGITLQRSKSKYVDEIGPSKILWHKNKRLGITFHEQDGGAIAIKDLSDAMTNPSICIGQELIGVNGNPIAGLELATVMCIIGDSKSPCELAFTPPPSPIIVTDAAAAAAARGVSSGHILVSVGDQPMIGCSLQQASYAIETASPERPVVLRFAPLRSVFNGQYQRAVTKTSASGPHSADKKALRNTLCITAVVAALTV